jgi:hypothetical protein
MARFAGRSLGNDDRSRALDSYDRNRASLLSRDGNRGSSGRTFTVTRNNNGGNGNGGNRNGSRNGNGNGNNGGRRDDRRDDLRDVGNNSPAGGRRRGSRGGRGGGGGNGNGNGNNGGLSRDVRNAGKRATGGAKDGDRARAGKVRSGDGAKRTRKGAKGAKGAGAGGERKPRDAPVTTLSMDEMLAAYQAGQTPAQIEAAGRAARAVNDLDSQLARYQQAESGATRAGGASSAPVAALDQSLESYMRSA